jgi:hypothetical protein
MKKKTSRRKSNSRRTRNSRRKSNSRRTRNSRRKSNSRLLPLESLIQLNNNLKSLVYQMRRNHEFYRQLYNDTKKF